MNDDAPPRDDTQMGRVKYFMSKMFHGVKGDDPTCAEYWLDGVVRILSQMGCSDEDKFGCTVSLLMDEAHR
ncbi:E3 ubiquitin-protein ligase COP1-like [Gossypium australe]|uniref:E3 ubiquitin-protein ligase COP1-like n=1 Tax=Gossypium australe TaxID=47621 RepID=A0A5B6X0W1_9ROSI|nr:E3 ubiquitin-protein ligase COP1-like [Gossypium australe]